MNLIFCSDPLNPKQSEELYESEYQASQSAGFRTHLIDFDALVNGDISSALRAVAHRATVQNAIYRGWMLTLGQYRRFYEGLLTKGLQLLTTPVQYAQCHHFPKAYPIIEQCTPKSVWLEKESGFDRDRIIQACQVFGDAPIVIKDYVKSQKHYWNEACYVPRANDFEALEAVVRRFIELQGEFLVGGLVFREFVPLKKLGVHPRSGMPLSREFRLFFFNNEPISIIKYWDEADDPDQAPPANEFIAMAKKLDSPFFAMDIAQTSIGDWLILEIGDGQVSGFSGEVNPPLFYSRIASILSNDND